VGSPKFKIGRTVSAVMVDSSATGTVGMRYPENRRNVKYIMKKVHISHNQFPKSVENHTLKPDSYISKNTK
jgi:hypothetical protein